MFFVLIEDNLELSQRIFESALPARDAAQLEMSVGLGGIDGHGCFKTLNRLRKLTTLLIDKTKLVLRFSVMRVQRGSIERAAKALTAAQRGAQIAPLVAQI